MPSTTTPRPPDTTTQAAQQVTAILSNLSEYEGLLEILSIAADQVSGTTDDVYDIESSRRAWSGVAIIQNQIYQRLIHVQMVVEALRDECRFADTTDGVR